MSTLTKSRRRLARSDRSVGGNLLLLVTALMLVVNVACGTANPTATTGEPSASTTPETTVAPATTTTVPAATVPSESVRLPEPGEPWDLLFFGFDDVLTRLSGELYADYAAEALDVEVRLFEPLGFEHVFAASMISQLRGERYPPLTEFVPPAEIVVLLSRPGQSVDGSDDHIEDDFESCWWKPGLGTPPTTDLPGDYWDVYRRYLDEVYTEIWDLRQGVPTVLITVDLYNPSLPQQQESGIDSECIAWFEAWSAEIADAARAHGSIVVSLHELFNGPTHDRDPAASGYIGPTDDDPSPPWYRATPAGAELIAQRLAEEGFEPTTPPKN